MDYTKLLMPLINRYNERGELFTHVVIVEHDGKEVVVVLEYDSYWKVKVIGEVEDRMVIE